MEGGRGSGRREKRDNILYYVCHAQTACDINNTDLVQRLTTEARSGRVKVTAPTRPIDRV